MPQNNEGLTPLHCAGLALKKEVCALLMKAGADKLKRLPLGRTLLHEAIFKGSLSFCSFLLSCGFDVNAQDDAGITPLHLAARYGYDDLCTILLTQGADVTKKTYTEVTIPRYAQKYGHIDLAAYLRKLFKEAGGTEPDDMIFAERGYVLESLLEAHHNKDENRYQLLLTKLNTLVPEK